MACARVVVVARLLARRRARPPTHVRARVCVHVPVRVGVHMCVFVRVPVRAFARVHECVCTMYVRVGLVRGCLGALVCAACLYAWLGSHPLVLGVSVRGWVHACASAQVSVHACACCACKCKCACLP